MFVMENIHNPLIDQLTQSNHVPKLMLSSNMPRLQRPHATPDPLPRTHRLLLLPQNQITPLKSGEGRPPCSFVNVHLVPEGEDASVVLNEARFSS